MIRIEDIIKQSEIIEYLEKRLDKINKKIEKLTNSYTRNQTQIENNRREWDNLWGRKEEIEENLNHLKEVIKNAENKG